jgi:predicted TIM-barrel fold metal-dependent hydrolase
VPPVIDIHVHIAAKNEPGCKVSREMESEPAFIYMLLADRVKRSALRRDFDGTIRDHILGAVSGAPGVDYAVLLALDAAFAEDGRRLEEHSHLVVTNEYVRTLARANPKVLVGASVNPNRGPVEGRRELADCLDGEPSPALVKLLPNCQLVEMDDARHDWFYEALAERGVPLLCHTGPENTIPVPPPADEHQRLGDPRRLRRALDVGVTVIAAHCAMRVFPFQDDHLGDLAAMMREAEENGRWRLFADVAAMCLICRLGTVDRVLESIPAERLILGSDYPVPVSDMPPGVFKEISLDEYLALLHVRNPLEKNVRQLLAMGFSESILTRAAELIPSNVFA